MLNEETGAEPRVVSASIDDSYLLIVRDDSTVLLAQMDENNNELEEMDRLDEKLVSSKWSMGCIYRDHGNCFHRSPDTASPPTKANAMAFLVTTAGTLFVRPDR
jgi:cleavage and polyadenylation specificity factor subunit 1